MPMPNEPWRSRLRPASFRGVPFHVDVAGYIGGRRTVVHEFPKRDLPDTEDMGRRARRFAIAAYIVGSNYDRTRDSLILALETSGPGALVHPNFGEQQVNVEPPFNVTERRERGRMCEIEVTFVEAGEVATSAPANNTQAAAATATSTASDSNTSTLQLAATQSGFVGTNNAGFGNVPANGFLNQPLTTSTPLS